MSQPPPAAEFSLIRGDPLYRAQRTLGLIPERGFGTGRRIVVLVALTWLPLALWAVWNHLFLAGVASEPLARHFGIHARFLFALPLLIAGESLLDRLLHQVVPQFLSAGLVDEAQRDAFRRTLVGTARLRDSRIALSLGLAVVLLASWSGWGGAAHDHELVWSRDVAGAGFVAFWFNWVSRPVFLLALLAWLWRLLLVSILFHRIAGLELRLAPTHPDRAGGLGFVEVLPGGFVCFFLALAIVIASRWGHQVMYHDLAVSELKIPALLLLLASLLLGLAPLTMFVPTLAPLRRRSLVAANALLADYGRLFQSRWLQRQTVDDDGMLGAPEIGPVADTVGLFDAVSRMRIAPIGRRSVAPIAVAVALPLVPVLVTQMPLKEAALKVLAPLIGL